MNNTIFLICDDFVTWFVNKTTLKHDLRRLYIWMLDGGSDNDNCLMPVYHREINKLQCSKMLC